MREQKIMRILEWLHPALLLPMICPALYSFTDGRSDPLFARLYLAGLLLIIPSAVSRILAYRMEHFFGWLVPGLLAAAFSCFVSGFAGRSLFSGPLYMGYMAQMCVCSLLLLAVSARIRMREKARIRAREENDTTWNGSRGALDSPSLFAVSFFAVCYGIGLCTYAPKLCDLAFVTGAADLLVYLTWRHMETTRLYLTRTEEISNVPKRKIRRARAAYAVLTPVLLVLLAIPAGILGIKRAYTDIRDMHFELLYEDMEAQAEGPADPSPGEDAMEQLEEYLEKEGRTFELPKWLKTAGRLLGYAVYAAVGIMLVYFGARGIMNYIVDFKGVPEENGDIAESLKDRAESIPRRVVRALRAPKNERERVRREYRRAIRKYRKEVPGPSETPREIEAAAAFPEGYDVESLHARYERARYGA